MNYICFNGKILTDVTPVLLAANSAYRYGDGLFETMKVCKGQILLKEFHFERLSGGLSLLKYEVPHFFSIEKIAGETLDLCRKNNCEELSRVRLSVFRGNGGLFDGNKKMGYVIEAWPLDESVNQLNDNGLVIDIYPDARKTCDKFANLKTASFLPYTMAALFANENKLNDCLILNNTGNVTDSTIANVFVIKDNNIITPALSEGCINGVMRKYLLIELGKAGYPVAETSVTEKDISLADEIFLTNAVKGIRWVKRFRNKIYRNDLILKIYNLVLNKE